MKVKLRPGSHMVVKDVEYKAGDILEMDDKQAKVQIEAGIVEEVKAKKSNPSKEGK